MIGWLAEAPGTTLRTVDGTVVFVDISGFTKMSERLARKGKVGAEEVTDVIGSVFARLLAVAYAEGGGLIKFGGDALLLLFTGTDHPIKGARAAVGMRQMLRGIGAIETTAGKVTLRMSVGLHSGTFHFFLVGDVHRELIIAGPGASQTVSMEGTATAGEILVSGPTAACLACLPQQTLGQAKGDGVLLRSMPHTLPGQWPTPEGSLEGVDLLSCIPMALREHVLAGVDEPEHRQVTIGFIHFDGTDEMVKETGPELVAYALDELVRVVQSACDKYGVTFLGTDVDKDGGKIILVTGAPTVLGEDEERMLLAAREIQDARPSIPVRIGVNRGHVFAGDVGPPYRRTYTVMGDAVNLAARVMAKAEPGQVLATSAVLDASSIGFRTEALEPFMVKGKRDPVRAHAVFEIVGSERSGVVYELPLTGREKELVEFDEVVVEARAGHGSLVEIVGPPGIGKTRLLDALRDRATGFSVVSSACELYEASTPYGPLGRMLREALQIPDEAQDEEIVAALIDRVESSVPHLTPWLPLLAVPLDVDVPPTPEVEALQPQYRRERLEGAVSEFLAGVFSGTPTLVEIEDVHWMDEASASLIQRLARDIGRGPWIVAVTRRDQDTGFVPRDLSDLRTLRPAPLESGAAESLLLAATEDTPMMPAELATLVDRSGGNPLFLLELLGAARAAGGVSDLPTSVEGIVISQIDRLPAADLQLLRLASVLGMNFSDDLMEALLEGEQATLDPAAWGRLREFLEETRPGEHRFRHALMRDAAYEGLPFRRRRDLHARVGDAICRSAGANDEAYAEVLSMHFFHAQRFEDAWKFARIAARWADEIYANIEARQLYERALHAAARLPSLEPVETAGVGAALGDVLVRLGDYPSAQATYRSARHRVAADALVQGELFLKEARLACFEGRFPAALRACTRGRKLLATAEGDRAAALSARMSAYYAFVRWAQGRYKEAITWCDTALAEGQMSGDLEAMAIAYDFRDASRTVLGLSQDHADSWKALELYERLGNLEKQADLLNNLGVFAFEEGRWSEARELYERARQLYLKIGAHVDVGHEITTLGEILMHQGRFEEAEARFREALRLFRASGMRSEVFASTLLGTTLARSGRFDEAGTLLDEVTRTSREVGDASDTSHVAGFTADHLVLLSSPEAPTAIGELVTSTLQSDPVMPRLLRDLGFALVQSGDRGAASDAFLKSLELARQRLAMHDVGFTLDAILASELTDGRPEEEMRRERDDVFERLGVVAVPEVPLHA